MNIWLFCICRDEEKIMPYFLRHYSTWVDKLIFYDDKSEDKTRRLITECPKAELRNWPGTHGIVDDEFTDFANEQWKEARGHADWVIWVDADEFVYHPNIIEILETYLKQGVELPAIIGYTMISDTFPITNGQIYDEIKTGFHDNCWCKNAVFRGNICYHIGRHNVNTNVLKIKSSPTAEIKLLHYRVLGMDYLIERHARNWARVPQHCRVRNYGNNCSPGWTGHHGIEWFREKMKEPRSNVI